MRKCRVERYLLRIIILMVIAFCGDREVNATTVRVPEDAASVQSGLDMAAPGDTVLVGPGQYEENIVLPSSVLLTSASGPLQTTLDGRGLGPVLKADGAVGFAVSGFTITGGLMTEFSGGAGASMHNANGSFEDCRFVANTTIGRDGAGISLAGSVGLISNCRFERNECGTIYDGGAIFIWAGSATVKDCEILGNKADEGAAIAVTNGSSIALSGSIVARNRGTGTGVVGAGLTMSVSTGTIENNTFFANETAFGGNCIGFYGSQGVFSNNIVVGSSDDGLFCVPGVVTSCNDVWASGGQDFSGCGPGPGDFSSDPEFCDAANFDLSLSGSSPCAPENSPLGCDLIGALGVECGVTAVVDNAVAPVNRQFKVYPNPVRSEAHFSLTDFTESSVLKIYGPDGRLVWSTRPSSTVTWNPGTARAGVYFARLIDDEVSSDARFIVVR